MTKYLLDTNVFIQAKNLHYGFDFCPAFWDWLDEQNSVGKVCSIEQVGDEILAGDDELAECARQRPGFFMPPDQATAPSLGELSHWANGAEYEPAGVDVFLHSPDYHLVAQAHARGCVVVTHEIFSPSTKRIKIPNACLGVEVKYVNPYQMLRSERARFILNRSL